ncbi:CvpA family protein [Fructilactobacillus vespulae]|uniref:CvpA family protein n=1 Tax=Fructilactobacillus vespulae TaxID=1249630 RepID=UPI0039B46DDA
MILSILIILIGIIALKRGFYRGFVTELVRLIGFFAVVILAKIIADPVATIIRSFYNLLVVDKSFSNVGIWHGIGFLTAVIVLLYIEHKLLELLNIIVSLPVLKQVNSLLGAITGLIFSLFVVAIVLSLAINFKAEWIVSQYNNSPIAQLLVNNFTKIFVP